MHYASIPTSHGVDFINLACVSRVEVTHDTLNVVVDGKNYKMKDHEIDAFLECLGPSSSRIDEVALPAAIKQERARLESEHRADQEKQRADQERSKLDGFLHPKPAPKYEEFSGEELADN